MLSVVRLSTLSGSDACVLNTVRCASEMEHNGLFPKLISMGWMAIEGAQSGPGSRSSSSTSTPCST